MENSNLPIRLIFFGTHTAGWKRALSPASDVWKLLPQIAEIVQLDGEDPQEIPPAKVGFRTVVLPLMDWHILRCPRSPHDSLFAGQDEIRTLSDKALFAEYATREGLGNYCPTIYSTAGAARFPCVFKRTNLNAGMGVAIARSAAELDELLQQRLWAGFPVLLQSYEGSQFNFVTHAVCVEGRIVSLVSYRQALASDQGIRTAAHVESEPFAAPAAALDAIGRLLAPLKFRGPCCVDYNLRPDGTPCIFEINPRLGGSLLAPGHQRDFAQIMTALLENARAYALNRPGFAGGRLV